MNTVQRNNLCTSLMVEWADMATRGYLLFACICLTAAAALWIIREGIHTREENIGDGLDYGPEEFFLMTLNRILIKFLQEALS